MTERQLEYATGRRVTKAFMRCVGVFPIAKRLSDSTGKPQHIELAEKTLQLAELANECMDIVASLESSSEHVEMPEQKTNVYLMLDESTGLVKIGRSKNPNVREQTLLSRSPSIRLLWHTSAYPSEEKFLHRLYKSVRVRGEWFDLSDNDIENIKSLDWRQDYE